MTVLDIALSELQPALRALSTEPMLVVRLQVSPPLNIGLAPIGERRLVAVSGGTFTGPSGFHGTVPAGGNDSITVRRDGTVLLDARIVLTTTTGDSVLMTYRGVRAGNAETMQRLAAGKPTDPSAYYFRISATFETASDELSWMNDAIAVGIGHREADTVTYSVFRIL